MLDVCLFSCSVCWELLVENSLLCVTCAVVDCCVLCVVCCFLFVVGCVLIVVCYVSFAVCGFVFVCVVGCRLFVVCC